MPLARLPLTRGSGRLALGAPSRCSPFSPFGAKDCFVSKEIKSSRIKSSRVVWQTERGCSGTQFERRPRRHNQGSIVDMGVYFGTLRIGVETPPYQVRTTDGGNTRASRATADNAQHKPSSSQVVRKCGGYEIRKYQPSVAAEVFVDVKDQFSREGGGKGFRPLAKYIGAFGTPENVSRSPEEATQAEKIAMTAPVVTRPSSGDSKGQKIAMTAPVVTTKSDDQSDGGGYWMQFIMPSKWTLETLPTPTDPNVKLKPIPEVSPSHLARACDPIALLHSSIHPHDDLSDTERGIHHHLSALRRGQILQWAGERRHGQVQGGGAPRVPRPRWHHCHRRRQARARALQRSVHSRLSENERGVGPDRGAQGVKMQAGARSGRRTRCAARTRRNPYPLNIT